MFKVYETNSVSIPPHVFYLRYAGRDLTTVGVQARKTVVEESNLSVLKDVSNSIKGRTRDIDQQTRRLLWSQSDFVHALERRIEGFSSRQNARFTEAGESIERFLVQLSAQLEAVSVGNSESRDSMTRYRRTIEETCRELFVRFTQHGTQATAEYDELSERIRDEVTRHESEVRAVSPTRAQMLCSFPRCDPRRPRACSTISCHNSTLSEPSALHDSNKIGPCSRN